LATFSYVGLLFVTFGHNRSRLVRLYLIRLGWIMFGNVRFGCFGCVRLYEVELDSLLFGCLRLG